MYVSIVDTKTSVTVIPVHVFSLSSFMYFSLRVLLVRCWLVVFHFIFFIFLCSGVVATSPPVINKAIIITKNGK